MADWQIVRYDPTYEEPLDAEIIPLLDALNAAGFITTSSCCGHGGAWPYVNLAQAIDSRIEHMARWLIADGDRDYGPYSVHVSRNLVDREVDPTGYSWCVEIHLHDAFHDTPAAASLAFAVAAIAAVTRSVEAWAAWEGRMRAANAGCPIFPLTPHRQAPRQAAADIAAAEEERRAAREWSLRPPGAPLAAPAFLRAT